MQTFEEIVKNGGFRKLYIAAIDESRIRERLESQDAEGSLDAPLKVLDLGGGTGTLGTLLEEEFGTFVEYVNVDSDEEVLEQSVGKKVHGDYTNLPDLLGGEKFDYVFGINVDNPSPPIDYGTLTRSDTEFLEEIISRMRELYEYLVLSNAAMSLNENGRFVRGGVLPEWVLKGHETLLGELGCTVVNITSIEMSMEVARELAEFDLKRFSDTIAPTEFKILTLFYSQNSRVMVYDRTRAINEPAEIMKINQALAEYSELFSYFSRQAQIRDA